MTLDRFPRDRLEIPPARDQIPQVTQIQKIRLLTQDFEDNLGDIFGQRFCNDLASDERSGGYFDMFLHRIALRTFLDGSGLRTEVW